MSVEKTVEPAVQSYSDHREGVRAEALRDALEAEGIVSKKTENVNTSAKPVDKTQKDIPIQDPFTAQFTKLTTAKEQFRKQVEAIKPYAEVSKHIPVDTLNAAIKAKQAGDPMALLTAFGFSHTDYVRQTAAAAAGKEISLPKKQEQEERPQSNSELEQLKAELAELRNERMQEKVQSQRAQVMSSMKAELTKQAEKFPLINGMERYDDVLRFIEQHVQRTGSPPGDTFEETVALAAAELESRLTQEKEKWSKVLTNQKPVVKVQSEAEDLPQAGPEEVVGKTLTNRMSATVAARPVSSDRATRIAEIAQDNSLWGDQQ